MRITLKDDGFTYKKIMHGRKWIGRVVRTADGRYFGRIGKTEAYGATELQAFQEVGARYFGRSSAADLAEANAQVRQDRRDQQVRILPAKQALQRGDFKSFFEELDRLGGLRKIV